MDAGRKDQSKLKHFPDDPFGRRHRVPLQRRLTLTRVRMAAAIHCYLVDEASEEDY